MKIIILVDGYDELKSEYLFQNLYDSNDLEIYRNVNNNCHINKYKYPKIIYTCRSETLLTRYFFFNLILFNFFSDYLQSFVARVTNVQKEDYDPIEKYMEY